MWVLPLVVAVALTQPPPVPQPFPRPGGAKPVPDGPGAPASSTPAPAIEEAPDEATLGAPVYPGSQFITSYDAGRGQRFYLFGTAASFATLVTYYRSVLKQRGDLVFEAPATHQFDTGRFREDTMAFPPSVTIKDYQSDISQGYPNPKPGAEPARFATIIQIVPPAGR